MDVDIQTRRVLVRAHPDNDKLPRQGDILDPRPLRLVSAVNTGNLLHSA